MMMMMMMMMMMIAPFSAHWSGNVNLLKLTMNGWMDGWMDGWNE